MHTLLPLVYIIGADGSREDDFIKVQLGTGDKVRLVGVVQLASAVRGALINPSRAHEFVNL